MKKILSKKVAAAILAGTLALSPLASALTPTMALAVDPSTKTSTITVKNVEGQTTGFDAYYIFNAYVSDDARSDTGKAEQNVSWASDAMKNAVETYIKSQDSTYAGTTAQDAADWIQSKINTDKATDLANGTYTDATVNKDSIAYGLANAIAKAGATPTPLTAGQAATLTEGYYLIVSDASKVQDGASTTPVYSETTGEDGTAPIFAVVGGSAVTVTEKASPVTVDKQVSEDGTNFTHALDAQKGKTLTYKLDGTLPKNYSTFTTYHYQFDDTMSQGLVGDASSVKVKVYNGTEATDITDKCTITAFTSDNPQKLTVNIADLKTLTNVTINKDSKIEVTYTAHLDPSKAVIGSAGNLNDVTLTYTRNPHASGDGTTTPNENKVFTYGLKLVKRDVATKTVLPGAKFTIQLTSAEGDTNNGDTLNNYVQADGTLGSDAYEFTTDDKGAISVTGLDAGTYTVTETSAPTGYTKISNPFTVKISSTIDTSTGTMSNLTNTLTTADGAHVIIGSDNGVADASNALTRAANDTTDADNASGMVQVTVGDVKRPNLPLTGQQGITMALIGGGTLVVVGLVASRRMNREDA